MDCDFNRISCQLDRLVGVLSESGPSTFDLVALAVAVAGVLASTFVGIVALILANRSNNQAEGHHRRDREDAALARRRTFGAALDAWGSAVLLNKGVGMPETQALLADQGPLSRLLLETGEDTTSNMLAWTIVRIATFHYDATDVARVGESVIQMSTRINEWVTDPVGASAKCDAERALVATNA